MPKDLFTFAASLRLSPQPYFLNWCDFYARRVVYMLIIVLILLSGIGVGYLLRRFRWLQRVDVTILLTIFLLLFILGWSVGGNSYLLERLPSCGGEALLLAMSAMVGSAVMMALVYYFFFRSGRGGRSDE